jgi:hypothetical protein
MGRNVKTLHFVSVAATLEKASTYVFAERRVRNAEARSSTPLCSTNNSPYYNNLAAQPELGLIGQVATT